jgi:transcriptional regulator with XRE-family HTH domain
MGAALGVTGAAFSRWETGDREIPDIAIRAICREFNVNEIWLRTGAGEMHAAMSREEELARLVRRHLSARPESLQRALITTLLRFDPDSPEWEIVEKILADVVAEWQRAQKKDPPENSDGPADSAE